jgi:hypothetical protein
MGKAVKYEKEILYVCLFLYFILQETCLVKYH